MTWDEPTGCTTPRGWLFADAGEHPIDHDDLASTVAREETSRAIGNYVFYPGRGFHICAYLCPRYGASHQNVSIPEDDRWHGDVQTAKRTVERYAATLLGTSVQGAL